MLGRLVEVLAGRSLGDAFRELIFTPLGMTDTGFGPGPGTEDRVAALYLPSPTGGLVRNDALAAGVDSPAWPSGGGGLTSTLADYHRFTQMLRGRGALGDGPAARRSNAALHDP